MSAWSEKLEDKVFGLLEWESKFDWFVGHVELTPGVCVGVKLSVNVGDEPAVCLKQAEQRLSKLKHRLPKIHEKVRDEFLALYNLDWADGVNGLGQPMGHGKITTGQFDEFVYLENIHFLSDGTIDLWFYDGDELFAGHKILVALDTALNITNSGLEG